MSKPFPKCKPRSEWKRPKLVGRVRGRIIHDIQVGEELGVPQYKLYVFELTSAGLTVRAKRGRKKNAKLWKFENLANGVVTGQMNLL